MDWQSSDWITLVGVIGAVLITPSVSIAVFILGQRDRQREREEQTKREDARDKRQRLVEAARILAPALTALNDSRMDIARTYGPRDIDNRWQRAREPLAELAVGAPSDEIAELAAKLVTAMDNVLLSTRLALESPTDEERQNKAAELHAEAMGFARDLTTQVRGHVQSEAPSDG